MQLLIAPKNFHLLGRLISFENPLLASSLITKYESEKKLPSETDLRKIEPFFISFCSDQNIAPSELRGAQYKRAKVDRQRLFIAVMIQVYAPHLFDQINKKVRVPSGLLKAISESINQDRSNAAKMMQEVITTFPIYDEFRDEAERIVTVLLNHA